MLQRLRRHPVACFVAVTYAVTWSAWSSLALTHRIVTIGASPLYLLGLLGPLVGAVATTAVVGGRQGLRELGGRMVRVRVGARWWLVALGVPVGVAAATYVVLVACSSLLHVPLALPSWQGLGQFTGFPIANALALWVMLVVVNGFGEETGWRGFLLPQLEQRWPPLMASLIVAVVWAAWHFPAFLINENYRAMPPAMLPMFFAGLVCGSVFLTWLHDRGRQSIALVAFWHGTYNLVSGTIAARGALAAVETTVVMVIALAVIVRELRERRLSAARADAR